jgi:hypothetical protein
MGDVLKIGQLSRAVIILNVLKLDWMWNGRLLIKT